MPSGTAEKPNDSRLIGLAVRAVRRFRGMTAQQVADAMNLPLRTYEYFEAGAGRINQDYIRRFAEVTDCDPWALVLGPPLGSTEFARRTADTKMILIFLIALGEHEARMGDRIQNVDPRAYIREFSEAFRRIETDHDAREAEKDAWLEAGRDRLAGKPPEGDG